MCVAVYIFKFIEKYYEFNITKNLLYVHELKDLEIPVLDLDREFYQADTTRLQTRIEAFLEMI